MKKQDFGQCINQQNIRKYFRTEIQILPQWSGIWQAHTQIGEKKIVVENILPENILKNLPASKGS